MPRAARDSQRFLGRGRRASGNAADGRSRRDMRLLKFRLPAELSHIGSAARHQRWRDRRMTHVADRAAGLVGIYMMVPERSRGGGDHEQCYQQQHYRAEADTNWASLTHSLGERRICRADHTARGEARQKANSSVGRTEATGARSPGRVAPVRGGCAWILRGRQRQSSGGR